MLAAIQKRVGEDEIRETLEKIGLDPDDKRTYRKYSLGMKQRLGIAAAVMENPDIVILDEPINALDESGAKQVRTILKEQKERGAVCIIACHFINPDIMHAPFAPASKTSGSLSGVMPPMAYTGRQVLSQTSFKKASPRPASPALHSVS